MGTGEDGPRNPPRLYCYCLLCPESNSVSGSGWGCCDAPPNLYGVGERGKEVGEQSGEEGSKKRRGLGGRVGGRGRGDSSKTGAGGRRVLGRSGSRPSREGRRAAREGRRSRGGGPADADGTVLKTSRVREAPLRSREAQDRPWGRDGGVREERSGRVFRVRSQVGGGDTWFTVEVGSRKARGEWNSWVPGAGE